MVCALFSPIPKRQTNCKNSEHDAYCPISTCKCFLMNGRVVRTEGEILTLTPTLTDTDTDTAIADAQGLIHPKANVINEEP